MSPTILRDGPYRLFFFSREERRPHVHVESADGEAKFWLEPRVELVRDHGLARRELNRLQRLVEDHREELLDAWNRHFQG